MTPEMVAARELERQQSRVRRRKVTSAAQEVMRPVRYLWEPYVPAGMLTVLGGQEGSGKTQIAFELAARVTRDGFSVVLLSPEDSRSQVTVPRLVAAGADLDKIIFYDAVDGDSDVTLAEDLAELGQVCAEVRAALVIFDPIVNVLSGGTDGDNYKDVSRELGSLSKWADERDLTVLALTHLRKASDGNALNQMMGSRAFTSKPRSVLMTGLHPDDGELRLLTHAKTNVGREGITWSYRIEGFQIQRGTEVIDTSRVHYLDKLEEFSAQSLMSAAKKPVGRPSKLAECVEFVRAYLEGHEGMAVVSEVKAAAALAGFGMDMLNSGTLKTAAGITSSRLTGKTRDKAQVWVFDPRANVTPSDEAELFARLSGERLLYSHFPPPLCN